MASTMPLSSTWRGISSSFVQPPSSKDERDAESLMKTLDSVNNCLPNGIVYRGSENDHDVRTQVFRWDLAPYEEVFQNGIKVNPENSNYDNNMFYNLQKYCMDEESDSIDSRRKARFGFISTTISNSYAPPIPDEEVIEIYRYEIYAPGGIWAKISLGDRDRREEQRYDEVAFVSGIAPQYIRSVQRFRLRGDDRSWNPSIERVDRTLIINKNFNPQSKPLKLLELQMPICDYMDENKQRQPLNLKVHPYDPNSSSNPSPGNGSTTTNPNPSSNNPNPPPASHGSSTPTAPSNNPLQWYTQGVTNLDTYVDAGFRSTFKDEAYYIQKNRCFLLNYDPTGTNDFIVDGPHFLYDMFRSLKDTPFGHHGIDCAFGRHGYEEAFIFCGNLCALFNYAPHRKNDKIVDGPMPIVRMFPFLKGSIFEGGIDAAFEATTKGEAYFFKGDKCAKVNYSSQLRIISIEPIGNVFPSLKGKPFETKVDAAYASHLKDEAYLFSNNQFAQVNFASRTVIYDGPIGSQAEAIKRLFPYKNRGVDL